MSSSSVEKIKERLSISDVIGTYIKLEKAGLNFKARCPFHNEKTPSFFLSSSRNTYYCFGCGAKGDIFTFVEEFEGVDFVAALTLLADRAGVTLEAFEPKEKGEKEELYKVLEAATVFFETELEKNSKAKEYLVSRGLSMESIKRWRIGYAPNEWRLLSTELISKGASRIRLETAGLIKRGTKDGTDGFYDVFRGRIIFPIKDSSGRVIAFSGRIFDDVPDAPKYLNSPETPLFVKSETLYGFDVAKVPVRKKDYSLLVEGQMDLLLCHQAGFDNALASSGTAFTEGHLLKLKRLSNRIMFVFDGDNAGFGASLKGGLLALSLGFEVKFASLPKGLDPADLIAKDVEMFRDALKNSKHIIDFHLDTLIETGVSGRGLLKEVEKKILPYVLLLNSSIEQSHFVSQISKKTGIPESAIWQDIRNQKINPRNSQQKVSPGQDAPNSEVLKRRNYVERRLVGILFWQESEKEKSIDTDKLRISLVSLIGDKEFVGLLEHYKGIREELIFEAESYYGDSSRITKEIEELSINLTEDILRERFVEIMRALDKAEKAKDETSAKQLLKEGQDITQKLSELSEKRRAT